MDRIALFAGDVEHRKKKSRVTYDSHLEQVEKHVHADGVIILNLASHAKTCRHTLLCTEYLAGNGHLPKSTPDIEPTEFCRRVADFAERRSPLAAPVVLAPSQTPYLFRQRDQPFRAVRPPPGTSFGRNLIWSEVRRRVRLERNGGFDILFYSHCVDFQSTCLSRLYVLCSSDSRASFSMLYVRFIEIPFSLVFRWASIFYPNIFR